MFDVSFLNEFRSYDPIRCQEPQWPRRPLAIGRRGLPLNPSQSAPGMSSTPSAQSHIRGYRSGGPQSSPSAGLPKSDYAHAAAAARPAKAGVSPKAARLAGTGAMSIRLPPGTSRRGPTATSRARRRWRRSPSPGACPWRASPRGAGAGARNPSSRALLSEHQQCILTSSGTPLPLGISFGWWLAWT